uniref:Uncharacterized protein n=1 Tax=Anguilla anguilla TaxID=7936 RepID=A0A0E9PDR5_ANGAN
MPSSYEYVYIFISGGINLRKTTSRFTEGVAHASCRVVLTPLT